MRRLLNWAREVQWLVIFSLVLILLGLAALAAGLLLANLNLTIASLVLMGAAGVLATLFASPRR